MFSAMARHGRPRQWRPTGWFREGTVPLDRHVRWRTVGSVLASTLVFGGALVCAAPMADAATVIQVSSAAQLEAIDQSPASYLGDVIELMNNIALPAPSGGATSNWTPLGNSTAPFSGTFNGQGYAITNVVIHDTSGTNVGFFGDSIGGTIENVGIAATVTGSFGAHVGVLVGTQNSGTITDSYATGSVSGTDGNTGGLVGDQVSGTISNSHATGSVSGSVGNYGGLVGYQDSGGSITDSYATGSVSGTYVGGLVGDQYSGSIAQSYAIGAVSGTNTGGLVWNSSGAINAN